MTKPVITSGREAALANETKIYLPQRKSSRGKTGWKLAPNMVVVDEHGNIVEEYEKVKKPAKK